MDRDFTASGPDELWVADFTYLRCWEGVVFFSSIIDVSSLRVVGWQFASQGLRQVEKGHALTRPRPHLARERQHANQNKSRRAPPGLVQLQPVQLQLLSGRVVDLDRDPGLQCRHASQRDRRSAA